jgi:predicted phage baseplate assembly protein
MSFPRPDLDDRRFQDLVDEAKRMIPRFLPEWTNHNVSDPGVTLIELFAWMTELTLYRLNRVPDRLYASFLDLVGISPYPASAASVDVTFIFSTVPEEAVLVPAGSEVSTRKYICTPNCK